MASVRNQKTLFSSYHYFLILNTDILFPTKDQHCLDNLQLSTQFIVHSAPFSHSPEDAFCLVSIETQNLFREASLHPGQLAVWIPLLLERHHLLKGGAKHGGTEDGISGVLDLLQTGLLQALKRERDTHTYMS